nr:endolytic transglycosylase MltG [Mycobacterium sp.]
APRNTNAAPETPGVHDTPGDATPGWAGQASTVAAAAAVFVMAVVLALVWNGTRSRSPVPQSATPEVNHDVVVQVHPGDDMEAVGERLAELGVVDSAKLLSPAARLRTPPAQGPEPGFYVVSPSREPDDVLAQLLDPRSRVGFVAVQAGRQLDDATDLVSGSVRPGLFSDIARASCVPTGGGHRCLSAEELRQSAAQSDVAALGIPDWARGPVAAMAGDHHRLEGLIGVGQWNFDPTATPAQVLATLITGGAARYDLNSLLSNAAAEHGASPYQVLIVASLLQRDDQLDQYRQSAIDLYDRVRSDRDAWRLPPAPVTVPGGEALAAAEHPNG